MFEKLTLTLTEADVNHIARILLNASIDAQDTANSLKLTNVNGYSAWSQVADTERALYLRFCEAETQAKPIS